MKINAQQHIEWFRHSAPYINKHRGKTFVIWLSGDGLTGSNFSKIIQDINLLTSLGIKLVLVHGSRPQIEIELARDGIQSQFQKGRRITDQQSLNAICRGSAQARILIESQLSLGLSDSPMHGARIKVSSGNYIGAKPIGVIDGVDHQQTGAIRNVNIAAIEELLANNHIVLLSNLAYSSTGEIFNLNSIEVAQVCSASLKADKLIYFTHHEGLLNPSGKLLRELEADLAIDKINPDQHDLFIAATKACQLGVHRAHIVSQDSDGALIQELFTKEGSGSLISQQGYESIREAKAKDSEGILSLIKPLEDANILVKRNKTSLEADLNNFSISEREGVIISCAALYHYEKYKIAELACICVHPDYRNSERGENLLEHMENKARNNGANRIFVLTTQTSHWFLERGFQTAQLDELPMSKQALYNYQRRSLILIKQL